VSTSTEIGLWSGSITYDPAFGNTYTVNFGATDSDGTAWSLVSWTGLEGAPTAGGVVQRAGDHGAYAPPQFYAARPITLIIRAAAQTQALRDVARATMSGAIPISDMASLVFNEPIPKFMAVRRSGELHGSYLTVNDVEFNVGLIAPDPRKYSVTLNSVQAVQGPPSAGLAFPFAFPVAFPSGAPPMSVTATNAGSFETRPTVVIQGPVTAPRVQNMVTGQTVGYTGLTLGALDTLTIDFMNRVATLNGAYRPADANSAWWVMPPGSTGVQLLGTPTSGSSITVYWRDAWI